MALASTLSASHEVLDSVEPVVVDEVNEEPGLSEDIPKPMPALDDNLLLSICSCESGDGNGSVNHYEKDGVTPLRGKYTPPHLGEDIGMCQINTMYHLESSRKLGFDIYEPQGNWDYAKHLLKTQGTRPWKASKFCWSKGLEIAG